MAWIGRAILAGMLLMPLGGACWAGAQAAATAAQGAASLPAQAPLPATSPAFSSVTSPATSSAYAGLPLQREVGPGAAGGMSWGLQLVLAVALVAVLAGVYQLRRRHMVTVQGGAALQSLQALRLAQGASLHVVQWGDEQLLLACTGAGVTVVSRRLPAANPAASVTDSRSGAA